MINRFSVLLAMSTLMILGAKAFALGIDNGVEVVSLSHTDETDAAVAFCREGLARIPMSLQRKVADAGIKVVVTPRTIFDAPEQSGSQVFTNGGTTDNAGGFFQSNKNRILIPERAAWRNSPPRFQGNRIIGVVRHEFGHALDHACGSISQQADYISAYKQDLRRLSSEQKINFAYYITGVSKENSPDGTASGRQELFAQTVCALCTRQPLAKDVSLLQSFPTVKAYILDLEPDLKNVSANIPSDVKSVAKSTVQAASATTVDRGNLSSKVNPDDDKAAELIQQHKFAKALNLLNGAIRSDPKDRRAHLLRGNCLSWLGRYHDALYDYNAAIRLNRQDPEPYLMRARAYGWLGQKLDQKHDEETARRIGVGETIPAPNER